MSDEKHVVYLDSRQLEIILAALRLYCNGKDNVGELMQYLWRTKRAIDDKQPEAS